MFLTCLRKELLQHILTLRYAMVLFVFVVLSMSSVAIRTHVYQRLEKNHQSGQTARARWAQDMRDIGAEHNDPTYKSYESYEIGWVVDKPPSPMMIFAAGLEDEMTRSIIFPGSGAEIYNYPGRVDPRQFWRPLRHYAFRSFLTLDMVHIVAFVCSLLALLLVFDSVSGEWERGTLKVLLAGPVPRDTVILSRFAAGLLVLVVPLVLCWAMATLYVTFVGHVGLDRAQLARVALMAAISVGYVSAFFALGMAASCLVKGSAVVLSICLAGWIGAVFVVPSLVPVGVKHLAPVPPAAMVTREKEMIHDGLMKNEAMQWFAQMADSGTYNGTQRAWGTLMGRVVAEENRRYADVDRQYTESLRDKLHLSLVLSRVSPTTSYVCASDDLAGTGPSNYLRYVAYLDTYLRELQTSKVEYRQKAWGAKKPLLPLMPEDWPSFAPPACDLRETIGDVWFDLVLLAGVSVALFMISFVAFLRYDPC